VTPQQRRRRARIAAHAAFLARFERQVDPDGALTPEQRAERARHARIAYMLQLAERFARGRRRTAGVPADRRHRGIDDEAT
jgi:hypothetical protein